MSCPVDAVAAKGDTVGWRKFPEWLHSDTFGGQGVVLALIVFASCATEPAVEVEHHCCWRRIKRLRCCME